MVSSGRSRYWQAPPIGDFRYRVTFEQKVAKDDAGGAARSDWTEQFTRWAAIQPLIGGEAVQASRLAGQQPVLIIVRDDSDTQKIAADWRAKETKRGGIVAYYAMKTAEDMERRGEFITMLAVAGDPDAG